MNSSGCRGHRGCTHTHIQLGETGHPGLATVERLHSTTGSALVDVGSRADGLSPLLLPTTAKLYC